MKFKEFTQASGNDSLQKFCKLVDYADMKSWRWPTITFKSWSVKHKISRGIILCGSRFEALLFICLSVAKRTKGGCVSVTPSFESASGYYQWYTVSISLIALYAQGFVRHPAEFLRQTQKFVWNLVTWYRCVHYIWYKFLSLRRWPMNATMWCHSLQNTR